MSVLACFPIVLRWMVQALPQGEAPQMTIPMAKITGDRVCTVPFPASRVQALKDAASAGLPEGAFVSSDDVLSALVRRGGAKKCIRHIQALY